MGPVVVARSWVLLLFPALLATILLLGEKLLHSLSFLQVELGRFHTMSPNTERELGVICLLLFRLPMSDSCFIIVFPLGITKLKLAG